MTFSNLSPSALRLIVAGGLLLFAFLSLAVLQPSNASAQGFPSICEQYPDRDVCAGPGAGEGVDDDVGPASDGDEDLNGAGSGDSDGNLPFTGYPLTVLILLLLALLATGLLIRAYLATRGKLGSGGPSVGTSSRLP